MSILRSLERRGADPRLPWGSSYIPTNGQTGLIGAGVPINDDTALSISTVFTCIAILSDAVSTLPLTTLIRTKDHSRVPVDPEPPLINNPWPDGNRISWLAQVMYSLLLRGNAFGVIASRDDMGYPTVIQLVHPDTVVARRNPQTGKREYRINGRLIPTEDIMHIPGLTPTGGFIGLNPVEYMRGSWGLASATEKYGGAFFSNGANPSGVLEYPGDLSETETLELKRAWQVQHQGVGMAQAPAVLTGGLSWRQISINPDDAQFLATRAFQQSDIAAFFRVPAHLALGVADRTANVVGLESIELQFSTYTLSPWLSKIESQLNDYLPPNQTVEFDLSRRVRGPSIERAQRHTLERNGGWKNIDEIRAEENLPPLADGMGQDYWSPLNFAPVDSPVFQDPALSSGGTGGGIENSPKAPPAPNTGGF